jgi:adenylate kinase
MVLLGAPGAGKGTQAAAVAQHFGVPAISTGEMFRAEAGRGTPLGRRVAPLLSAGSLVPDDVAVAVVRERLAAPDIAEGFVLDGFPRAVGQAEALDALLAADGYALDRVVELVVGRDELLRRLAGRGRPDDHPDTVAARLNAWETENGPLVTYYRARGVLAEIDAGGPVTAVTARAVSVARGPSAM